MAGYKVPQDVEADDKLIGPFTFRQFIYLIIVAMAVAIGYGLSRLFIGLAIIPAPIVIFFGALALPLRKDQPMEIYLAAIVSFYLKPRRRLWEPDGIESPIEILAPKIVEIQRTKDITQVEAQKRLGYLAQIVDSRGWAIRGPGVQAPNSSLNSDVYFEAQQIKDVLDTDNATAQSFNSKLDKSDADRRDKAIKTMLQPPIAQTAPIKPRPATPVVTVKSVVDPKLEYNPYPEDIVQSVVQPAEVEYQIPVEAPIVPTTSEKPIPADIINLASNADLSVATIARVAKRIQDKQDLTEEVVISLR